MSGLNNRLSVALGREVNLYHDKMHPLVLELLQKVEEYKSALETIESELGRGYPHGK